MTVVLDPTQTPSGVGLVQGDIGPGDTRFGRYLYVVSGCCQVELETVVMAGTITQQRCAKCRTAVFDAPQIAVRLDMSRQTERVDILEFVCAWTGLVRGDLTINIEWDLTS